MVTNKMNPETENKIILIRRKSRLDELVAKFNTVSQAKFYVEHLGADFSDYLNEHNQYQDAFTKTERYLRKIGRVHVLDRSFLPNFIFGKEDLVVVLGQDGLVANTMKYLSTQTIVGVNPDSARWDGVLLPFAVKDLPQVVPEVLRNKRNIKSVTIAKAELNNGQCLYGVNDLFIGPKSHVSAHYVIRVGGAEEQQSSSGVIVSTGLGSTGWFKSIVTGALGIAGQVLDGKIKIKRDGNYPWDSQFLYFSVREPFPSKTSSSKLVFGKITQECPMTLLSHMPENGVIFSDGIVDDFLEFNSGTQATISIAEKMGRLAV